MRFDPCRCPQCGELMRGTCDLIPAIALIWFDRNGEPEFAGESEILWDSQETPVNADGLVDVICPRGHVWQAKQEELPSADPTQAS